MDFYYVFILLSCVLMHSCQSEGKTAMSRHDPSSGSRPESAIIRHISLALNVDFDKEVLEGEATLHFDVLSEVVDVPLDVNNLTIESVECEGVPMKYKLGNHVPQFGSILTITLPKPAVTGERLRIKIKYATSPQASGLTWLKPAQTAGRKYPYVFSQSSPIHARSILPCQDTPAVKFTFDAEVTTPKKFIVLLSAIKETSKNNKTRFNQPLPIPSNLFAIAVGHLDFRTIGPRTKVWSEKSEVARCAAEFSETEKFIQAAQNLCGPYEWTRYDLLVLPPAFPHGAMENPCLTFVSPTIVAGDKSLADVIIHEIMHSWTGNSVSIKSFEHFWLKEGFTVFLERKVAASFINDTAEAKRSRDFHSLLGLQALTEGINTLGATNPLTKLRLNLEGVHPDEAFSIVPYEKGSLFLRYLEDLFGGPEVFDDYIRSYLTKFRMQSIDTDEFKEHFIEHFKGHKKLDQVDWDAWLDTSGMPPVIPNYDTTMIKAVTTLVADIANDDYTFSPDDVYDFNVHQVIYLMQLLIEKPPMPLEKLTRLGEAYDFIDCENKEIEYRWLRLRIRSKDEEILGEVFNFLNEFGRLKYVRPLYRELYAWEKVREQAVNNFLENEQYMSHLTAYNLRNDLHLNH